MSSEGGRGPGPTFDAQSKSAKNQISPCPVRVRGVQDQLLMLSPNLLKTKFPHVQWGGEFGTNFQLLMLSPNLLKTKFPHVQ